MLIKFLRDFRSAATGEQFYEAGAEADLARWREIVDEGAAEVVTITSRTGQVKEIEALPFEEDDAPVQRGRPRKAVR